MKRYLLLPLLLVLLVGVFPLGADQALTLPSHLTIGPGTMPMARVASSGVGGTWGSSEVAPVAKFLQGAWVGSSYLEYWPDALGGQSASPPYMTNQPYFSSGIPTFDVNRWLNIPLTSLPYVASGSGFTFQDHTIIMQAGFLNYGSDGLYQATIFSSGQSDKDDYYIGALRPGYGGADSSNNIAFYINGSSNFVGGFLASATVSTVGFGWSGNAVYFYDNSGIRHSVSANGAAYRYDKFIRIGYWKYSNAAFTGTLYKFSIFNKILTQGEYQKCLQTF